MLILQPWSC